MTQSLKAMAEQAALDMRAQIWEQVDRADDQSAWEGQHTVSPDEAIEALIAAAIESVALKFAEAALRNLAQVKPDAMSRPGMWQAGVHQWQCGLPSEQAAQEWLSNIIAAAIRSAAAQPPQGESET